MNQKGFTLIEMLVVLLVISILLIITVPNITKHQSTIQDKGCSAFVKMVQAQVQAYQIDKDTLPTTVDQLKTDGYLKETACPNGDRIAISAEGEVTIAATPATP
ncbi:prepilin-type N-terminal cleavage/methylation domain-containing protein [Peribacillus saganii]|uniref:ComG operon protein 3 n=1 Tax=Peribacillus saganii TaxID=2303992 RepID=A0A372LL03_9BACI|nr:competence type IV pilus major pilin ComGC [Peribacillus saganii]RFU66781.1 prepilin-type N-terminal cleavage/methylation domain-containing protein [Peribacillus saganii]